MQHKASNWLFTKSEEVTKVTEQLHTSRVVSRAELDWLFAPKVSVPSFNDRVLARLIQAEAHEPNIHLKSDYRQAFICLTLAGRGNTEPFTVASYSVHGCHPDKVWAKIQADRHARLAAEYSDWFDAAGNLRPDVPKKPSLARGEGNVAEPAGTGDTPIQPVPVPLKKAGVA